MDIAAFNDLVDRFGADPARWPPHMRATGLDFLDRSAEARAVHGDLLTVEAVLLRDQKVAFPDPMIARRAMLYRQKKPTAAVWRRAGWAAAAAVALLLGVAVGQVNDHNESADRVFASSFDSGDAVDVD